MRKAVFLDYTGTIIQEGGEELKAVVTRVCRSSSLHDPQAVLRVWWGFVKQCEETYCGAHYCTEDEIVDQALRHFTEQYGLRENLGELHALIQAFWVNAPLFPDVAAFCADCPLPFYVISNNGIAYVERAMERSGLHPAGIITADMVRAYKPHPEIFRHALEVSGCAPQEAIHIGDSYSSDVAGARAAGIAPVLIQRTGDTSYPDVPVIRQLSEALALLR